MQPTLTGHEVSEVAKTLTYDSLALKEAGEFKEATRERLRVNAVTAFELFRVLRDGRTSDQFIDDMKSLVWDRPIQRNAHRAVAVLAAAKNTEAMSQLSRHFEVLLQGSGARDSRGACGRCAACAPGADGRGVKQGPHSRA